MAGTAVDAAAAVNAVRTAEEAILGVAGRVEAEGAGFGTETAFDACVRDANGGVSRVNRLVDFPHRADGAPDDIAFACRSLGRDNLPMATFVRADAAKKPP